MRNTIRSHMLINSTCTAQEMKFSIKDSFSKCDQICRKLRVWSHLLKKSLMENFIFFAVIALSLFPDVSIFSIRFTEKAQKTSYLQNLIVMEKKALIFNFSKKEIFEKINK